MPRLYVQKHTIPGYGPGFFPADEHCYRLAAGVPDGQHLSFEDLRQPRSIERHRYLFGLLHKVYENLPERFHNAWPTFEGFLRYVKVRCGWRDDIYDADCNIIGIEPRSLSFSAMDEMEFRSFVGLVKDLLAREIWPEIQPPSGYGHNSGAAWNEEFAKIEKLLFGDMAERRG